MAFSTIVDVLYVIDIKYNTKSDDSGKANALDHFQPEKIDHLKPEINICSQTI
jgi:hypothetical protein